MFPHVEAIAQGALSLLEDPGVRIEHEPLRGMLKRAGAREGAAADVVRFPAGLVKEKLALCPARFRFADRAGGGREVSPDGEAVVWSVPGMNIWEAGRSRPFASADMARWARLLDRLPNVDGVFSLSMDDVPAAARDVAGLRIIAENTTKHVRVLCFSPEGMDAMVRMKQVVGPYPWFSIGFTAHGPLRWTWLALEIFRRTAGHGIPITVNGEPMAGVSAPVTLAGACAVGTAEILAGIVLNQILEPGRPCVFNLGLAHTFDMRTAVAVTGGPENALYAQASAALGRHYGIPSASWVSTEAMRPDAQAALEKMFGFATHLGERVSNIWSVGQLESELTVSPAMAVIDDEMIAFARRYYRGMGAGDSELALDLVRSVGIAGSFLAEEHTAERFKEELFMPSVLFRRRRADWESEGSRDLEAVAEERAGRLMAGEARSGLTEEQRAELGRIAAAHLAR